MSDPTGTAGRSHIGDLEAAMLGAPDLAERINRLNAAKDAHDGAWTRARQALDDLHLGMAASDALREASAKHDDAQAALDNAKARAFGMVAGAQAKASGIITEAEKAAAAELAEARAEADRLTSEAGALWREANSAAEAMKLQSAKLEEQLDKAGEQIATADRLGSEANLAIERMSNIKKRLTAVLAEIR